MYLVPYSFVFPTFFKELSTKILLLSEQPNKITSDFSLRAKRLRYSSGEREIVISFNLPTFSNPTSTRLVPPVTWLTSSGSRVKVLHTRNEISPTINTTSLTTLSKYQPNTVVTSSALEISISRKSIDKRLSLLRMNGFSKEDISRMFDKGPWILAFDISSSLIKLITDLKDLQMNQSQVVHVISHCPYLLAQYCQWKGRDVLATAKALI